MKIAAFGSASSGMDESILQKCDHLGIEIAKRGHTLITGACPGFPHAVAMGAFKSGGAVIGYSPSTNLRQHVEDGMPQEGYTEFRFLPADIQSTRIQVRYKLRNMSSVEECDAAIIIGGRVGTLNEYTLMFDFGKPIGALLGTGGVADALPEIVRLVPKTPTPFMCFSKDYNQILDELEKAVGAKAE